MGVRRSTRSVAERLRAGGSLRLKLAVAIVLIVLAVLSGGIAVDYRRERGLLIEEQRAKLMEQVCNLAVVYRQLDNPTEFRRVVDAACANTVSPDQYGHMVLVLGTDQKVIAESSQSPDPAMRSLLLSPKWRDSRIPGHNVAQARLPVYGVTFIAAEYMDHVEQILREELASRLLTSGLASAAIVLTVYLMLSLSVLRPLARMRRAARAWAGRDFSTQVVPSGAEEVQRLSGDLNAMANLLRQHEEHRSEEMEQARRIQANLMPKTLPSVSGLKLETAYRPAEEVAGDLYDVFPLPNGKMAVAILDVSGHGISAAMLTGIVKMSLHHRFSERTSPAEAIELVNADLLSCVIEGQFVTVCVGVWDRANRTWTYVGAGHAGGVLQSGGRAEHLPATGPLLGVLDSALWQNRMIPLRSGDRLFLYTDGVTEAGKPQDGLDAEGLEKILQFSRFLPMSQQIAMVMQEVEKRNASRAPDDSTIVGVEVLSGEPAAPVAGEYPII